MILRVYPKEHHLKQYMDFKELYSQEVLIELGIISIPFIFGSVFTYRTIWQRSNLWRKRHFYGNINISINTIEKTKYVDGLLQYTLHPRTIMDLSIDKVIPNQTGIDKLIKYANKTSYDNPFIRFDNDTDRNAFSHLILDQIACLSHNEWLIYDMLCHRKDTNINDKIAIDKYIFAFAVWPQNEGLKNAVTSPKIRIILVKQDILQELINETNMELFNPTKYVDHRISTFKHRFYLILKMAKMYELTNKIRDSDVLFQCELAIKSPNYYNIINHEIPSLNYK